MTVPGASAFPGGDLLAEAKRARDLLGAPEGVKATVDGIRLVNDAILGQVLFALWDSGFYEYSLAHSRFRVEDAALGLRLNPDVLRWLLNHLVGRGIVRIEGEELGLTAYGEALSNAMVRGTVNLYLGGYGRLMDGIGRLLSGEIRVGDASVARSGFHTGAGSEQMTCVHVAPAVRRILGSRGCRRVLDLGCGTGGFLFQLIGSGPQFTGVGLDVSEEAIAAAQARADALNLGRRVSFIRGNVGTDPLPAGDPRVEGIDCVTALYLLHEFGRGGRAGIVEVLRQIREAWPGCTLVIAECLPADAADMGRTPPTTYSQLDYLLIHPLSGQGLPMGTEEWTAILEEAGAARVDVRLVHWIALYVVDFPGSVRAGENGDEPA